MKSYTYQLFQSVENKYTSLLILMLQKLDCYLATATAAVPAHLGAESLKKPHDIITLSFRKG